MFRSIFRAIPIIPSPSPLKNDVRSLYTRKLRRVFRRWFNLTKPKPPYTHITQIGDPILRAPSLPIDPDVIPVISFKFVIEHMKRVMKLYNNVGISASQVGLPWRVFAIQVTAKQLKNFDEKIRNSRGMEVVPLQVFINPTMKILDHRLISFPESCESIRGYEGVVPRAKMIEITALNAEGAQFTSSYKDWTARIIQHEMDHLNGILYTDKMDRTSFSCTCWNEVNLYRGNMEIKFDP